MNEEIHTEPTRYKNVYYGNAFEWLQEQNIEYIIERNVEFKGCNLTALHNCHIIMNIRGCNKINLNLSGTTYEFDVNVFDEDKFPLPLAYHCMMSDISIGERSGISVIIDTVKIINYNQKFTATEFINPIYGTCVGLLAPATYLEHYMTE